MPAAVSAKALSDLIWKIYGCALDRSQWPNVLDDICKMMHCEQAFLHLDDLQTRQSIVSESAGIDDYWLALQPQMAPEVTGILTRVLDSGHSLDEPSVASRFMTQAELEASPYAQNWGAPQGLVDYMDLFLIHTPFRLASLGLGRHRRRGLIQDREIELGRLLIPHLRRAVTISNLVEAQSITANSLQGALNAVGTAVVIVDAAGKIEFCNPAALELMAKTQLLLNRGGRIASRSDDVTADLLAAITRAVRTHDEPSHAVSTVRLTDNASTATLAHVLPLSSVAEGPSPGRPKVAILAQIPVEITACATEMARMHALTPGETRLLEKLLACQTLIEAAKELRIGEPTARTHLSRIFAKTGTSRQSELLRLAIHVNARSLTQAGGAVARDA